MKKIALIISMLIVASLGYSQTDTIKVLKGQKWYKPNSGYGQDTLQAYQVQNKNSAGNAGFVAIVGTDTVILRLDSSGYFRIDSASVVFSDTVETKMGYKFPDGTFQTTSAVSQSWSSVLGIGNVSGGTNPQITDGDSIEFLSGVVSGYILLEAALGGDREWKLPGTSGTFALTTDASGIYGGSGSLSGATTVTMGSDWVDFSGDPTGGVMMKWTNTGIGNSDLLMTVSGQVTELLSNGDLAFAGNKTAHTATPDMFIAKTTGNVGIGNVIPTGLLDVSKAVTGTPSTTGQYLSFATSTFTDNNTAGSGTAASMVFNSIAIPTLAASNASVTTTDASTFYLAGAPAAGTNMTITNPYSLWVDAGNVRFDGELSVPYIDVADSIKLNGIVADSIIPATSFTGNLGNSTTGADTLFSSVARIGDATNYTEIQSDGTVTLVGTARVLLEKCYNPSQFDITAGTPAVIGVLTNTPALLFDATTQEHASITFEVPEDIDLTVNPVIKIHLAPVAAQSSGSSFVFQIENRYIGLGEAVDKAADETLNSGAITVSNTAFILAEVSITLNASLMAAGDHFSIGLDRLTVDGNDDRNGDAGVLLMEFEYTTNKLGE